MPAGDSADFDDIVPGRRRVGALHHQQTFKLSAWHACPLALGKTACAALYHCTTAAWC